MIVKKVIPYLLLFAVAMSLAGCWNSRELRTLAFVLAMGIDKSPNTNEYQVSFQVVIPGAVATGITGGGGAITLPITIYTGSGDTLFGAIRKTSKKVPRQLFFAHLQLLVIGEEAAKEGIQDVFDFFERSHEPRLTTMVLVARGSEAKPIISNLTSLEKIPANSIAGKVNMTSKLWSENMRVELYEVLKGLASEGEPLINGVRIRGDKEEGSKKKNVEQSDLLADVNVQGITLFKNGKLTGWLDDGEARGTLWLLNKIKSSVVELDCEGQKNAAGLELIRSITKVKAEIKDENPIISVHVKEEANVTEVKCPIDLSQVKEKINELLRE